MRSSSLPLPLEVGGHPIEVGNQPPQLVRRGFGDARAEVAARDPAGGARQPVDGIADALGHVIPDGRAEQGKQHGRKQHATIEGVDLAIDFLLAQRERHGENGTPLFEPHRRGREHVRNRAQCLPDPTWLDRRSISIAR